jgi:hypothetical protein
MKHIRTFENYRVIKNREEIIKDFYNQILLRQPAGHELNDWLKIFHFSRQPNAKSILYVVDILIY